MEHLYRFINWFDGYRMLATPKKKCIYHYFVGVVQGQVLGVKPRGLASISSSSHCKAAIYMYKAAAAAAAGPFLFCFSAGRYGK